MLISGEIWVQIHLPVYFSSFAYDFLTCYFTVFIKQRLKSVKKKRSHGAFWFKLSVFYWLCLNCLCLLVKYFYFLISVCTLATSCDELTQWKRPWCWERLGAGGERNDRGWDGWMASPTWWAWVWVNSGSWWWTGRPGMLRFMGSQRVRHDWVTELNWTELKDWDRICMVLTNTA